MIQTELNAFEGQINLKLLGSIVSFVTRTANTTQAERAEMRRRCIFSDFPADSGAMQREYGFLYLGELLERYEERFGMTLQDRRAIALALGYTRAIAAPEMFIGSQKADFIQAVRRCAEHDIYLTGALYLIHEGQSSAQAIERRLKEWKYAQTEELIFAMSLFPDAEQAFTNFSGLLVRLLGEGRTIPVLGNADIFKWAIATLFPLKKRMKARRMDLLRALLSLPVSFVKEGSKHYGWLQDYGYTPIEIAYANAAALCSGCVPGGPVRGSITAEKLIVSLFRTVLSHDQPLPDEVYRQLTQIYGTYAKFDIKCHGEYRLADTLKGGLLIQTPETMSWFIGCSGEALHPATGSFDIMNPKWDPLAGSLAPEPYRQLFEDCLTEDLNAGQIRERLDRYRALTQRDYLDCYSTDGSGRKFDLLVKAGVIDLWAAFQDCLAEDRTVSKPVLARYIGNYCHGIKTIHAFEFFKRFLPQYGYQGMTAYLNRYRSGFEGELWERKGYGDKVTLSLQRDFLSDDPEGQRLMLHWANEFFFTVEPQWYLSFVLEVLTRKELAALLSPEDQRGIFDVVIAQSELSACDAGRLKQRYLTPEEQQAEQAAKEAAEAEKKRQGHLKMVQDVEAYYTGSNDGTFEFAVKFLIRYRYDGDKESISQRVLRDGLEQLLHGNGYVLVREEADRFLVVCRELLRTGTLGWAEFQSHIMSIKEVMNDGPDGDPDE